MFTFQYIDESLKEEWEKFVKGNETSGFMQSCFWSEFKRNIGWETFKIGIKKQDKLIGGAVVAKFHSSKVTNFLYIPEGPVIPYFQDDSNQIFHSLISEIDKIADLKGDNLTTHLRIEPRLKSLPDYFHKFQKAPFNLQPKNTLIIDLTKSEQEILDQMKPNGKYSIKLALRSNLTIAHGLNPEHLKIFLDLYQETIGRNKFEGKDKRYFEHLLPILQRSENGRFFIVSYEKKPLTAGLILFYGNRATYFFAGSSREHKEKSATYLMQWGIIKYSKSIGLKFYDLWGVAPKDANPSHDWYGFTKFKEKFGGNRLDFIGAYDFIYNERLYEDFIKNNEEI